MFNIRNTDLLKLDSMTKYPSIPTYHEMGDRGILQPTCVEVDPQSFFVTEKVDGTNARIIFCPDGSVLLGSRDELVWSRGDLIGNPSMGIIAGLKNVVESLVLRTNVYVSISNSILVLFGEFYGVNVGAASKNYSTKTKGFRLFDSLSIPNWAELMELPREKISSWREHGGQQFDTVEKLDQTAKWLELPLVPALAEGANFLPTDIESVYEWLKQFSQSKAALDETGAARAEGVVVRTADRKTIFKIRFEDYERTLRQKKN
jgi:hypothetical protein